MNARQPLLAIGRKLKIKFELQYVQCALTEQKMKFQ